jgi:aspartokinase-like uncharacterized kinase
MTLETGDVSGGAVDAVVKIGGGLLRVGGSLRPGALDIITAALADAAHRRRLVVVPGGGPFADAVRTADAALSLDAGAAHWMAVLAMDQMAHLLAARVAGAVLVHDASTARAALDAGELPVLAPYRWLRAADPLPHCWAVTSDSIAAWLAGALGARRLILVKPVAGELATLVDEYFPRALPTAVHVSVVAATPDRSAFTSALTRALDAALGDTESVRPPDAAR